jgi:hypothetical protein
MNTLVASFILNVVIIIAYYLPFAVQITLTMTTFLTFSVQSLNIANFLPVQSKYFPMISIYFLASLMLTFSSMAWFWYSNNLRGKTKLPSVFRAVADFIKRYLSCLFAVPQVKDKEDKDAENEKLSRLKRIGVNDLNCKGKKQKFKLVNKSISVIVPIEEAEVKTEMKMCSKCEITCPQCIIDNEKENEKKKQTEIIETEVKALNILASALMALCFIAMHVGIWGSCISFSDN